MAENEPFFFRAIPVCLLSPGKAVITGWKALGETGDVRVDAVAVGPHLMSSEGAGDGTLAAVGLRTTDLTVTRVCAPPFTDPAKAPQELAVQFSLHGPRAGRTSAVRLYYGRRHLDVPVQVALCGAPDPTTRICPK